MFVESLLIEWTMTDIMEEETEVIKEMVADTLVHKAIGDSLHCVFVDNGLLRCVLD